MGSAGDLPIDYTESMGDMDVIFAGGGTAACVAAGRLAKANPDLKILLVEGGPNQYQVGRTIVVNVSNSCRTLLSPTPCCI
jgi:choline dehydrogenase-like flavoprotein